MKRISKKQRNTEKDQDGFVLFSVVLVLSMLALLSGIVFILGNTDVNISGAYYDNMQAFYNADAGVNYTKERIENSLQSGTLVLDSPTESVNYSMPAGYNFDPVTTLTRLGYTNAYMYSVTGYDNDSMETIEVVVKRRSHLQVGLVGLDLLDMQPNFDVYSYYSSQTPNPTAADSTGEGNIGSNVKVEISPNSDVDGSVMLGDDGSTPAEYSGPDTIPHEYTDPFEEDPLGLDGGALWDDFVTYSDPIANDNLTGATPPIVGDEIDLGPGDTVILTAGNYYVENIDMGPDGGIMVDNSAGPVNLYVNGDFKGGPNSVLNSSGLPTEFTIYYNSTEDLKIMPNWNYQGFIYAPFADVLFQPNGPGHGGVFSKYLNMQPNSIFYIDLDLLDKFLSNNLQILSWKEVDH